MRYSYYLLCLFVSFFSFAQNNQLWKGYYSYEEAKAVEQDNETIYVATDNAVFAYNQNTAETEIYNTVNGLKIDGIHAIAYDETYKKLVLGSSNGKVAIIDLAADKIYHLNDIFTKTSIPDSQKQINKITIHNGFAYLATGYGITAVRLNDNHFGDTYYIGAAGTLAAVQSVAVLNNQMYAVVVNEGLKKASTNGNLIDYNNWQIIDFGNWLDIAAFNNQIVGVKEDLSLNTISATNEITPVDEVWGGFLHFSVSGDVLIEVTREAARLRSTNLGVYNDFIFSLNENGGVADATFANGNFFVASNVHGGLKVPEYNKENIEYISPSGPQSNNVFALTMHNKDLWVTFGGYDAEMNPYEPNGLTRYGISYLKNMQNWNAISFQELQQFKATVNVSFNPQKPNLAYISSFHDGLGVLDLNTDEFTIYNYENTGVLQPVYSDNEDVRINGVAFDRNGTGWMTNSLTNPFLAAVDKNNQFQSYDLNQGDFNDHYLTPVVDKNNTKWIGSRLNGLFVFNETRNKSMHIDTYNSDLPDKTIRTLAVDYNNQLWIGTTKGLRVLSNVDQFLSASQLNPTNIVIMDDGKAQELFFEQDILAITVDGSNNKWVAVADAGVFLISGNGQETIYKFTQENSPLPSNDVLSIEIDGTSGEVFFGTRKGIVSFKNYATTPSENLDDIKVYPNPVKPEYAGDVKISGVTSNATVKITDVAGNLVYETKSLGGTVTWSTQSFSGAKVSSGVYMIFITSEDGTLDAVKKVMIIR